MKKNILALCATLALAATALAEREIATPIQVQAPIAPMPSGGGEVVPVTETPSTPGGGGSIEPSTGELDLSMLASYDAAKTYVEAQLRRVAVGVSAPSMVYGKNRTWADFAVEPGEFGADLSQLSAVCQLVELDIEVGVPTDEITAFVNYSGDFGGFSGSKQFRLEKTDIGWKVPAWALKIEVDFDNYAIYIPIPNFTHGDVQERDANGNIIKSAYLRSERWWTPKGEVTVMRFPAYYLGKNGVMRIYTRASENEWPTGKLFNLQGQSIEGKRTKQNFSSSVKDVQIFRDVTNIWIQPQSEFSPTAQLVFTKAVSGLNIRAVVASGDRVVEEAKKAKVMYLRDGKWSVESLNLPVENESIDSAGIFYIIDIEWPTPRRQKQFDPPWDGDGKG